MKKPTTLLLSLLLSITCVFGINVERGKTITFSMKDNINLPTYSWPSTLISYSLNFSEGVSGESDLILTDNLTGETVPFQFTNVIKRGGKIYSADINFITHLPSGGKFSYSLKTGKSDSSHNQTGLFVEKKQDGVRASNNLISFFLPNSPSESMLFKVNDLSGPAEGVAYLNCGQRKLISAKVSQIESGAIISSYKIDCTFDNNGTYSISLKLVKDYSFVIIDEEISGFEANENVSMDMVWNHWEGKWRFSTMWDRVVRPNNNWHEIDKPIYTSYSKEDPFWTGHGTIEDPSDKMLFRLASFGGNSVREQTPLISFWGDSSRELGVFVYDHNKWDDRKYGVWQQEPDISIYFRYKDKQLYYIFPLVSGSRSSAVAVYDKNAGESACARFGVALDALGDRRFKSNSVIFRYANLLHSWYGLLNLNMVKDWVLEYPEYGKRAEFAFSSNLDRMDSRRFVKEMKSSPMAYYMLGLNAFPGIHSIEHRGYYGKLVQSYQEYYSELTPEELARTEALLLLAGYVNMTEAMNAIRTCIAGTANMAADGWSVPSFCAAMFPEHPMAQTWSRFFEKSLELYGLFYTRPEVQTYGSKGGRWAESLGIYNWAYLKPTITGNIALVSVGQDNCFANPYMVSRAEWMRDMLTAPVVVKRKHETEAYPQRVYTAHGAHSGGRFVEQFAAVYEIGKFIENYEPIIAENMYWCGKIGACQEGKQGDSNWGPVFSSVYDTKNNGTNPHLTSVKYTGHGIVLRSGVDTSEELSIHLEQVDKGPNYRWGNQGDGNSGGIYFYAGGKIWSGHENESAGDHSQNDLDNVCNFGVMKDGRFQTIGYNELKRPLFNLDVAQFAEVVSVDKPGMSSWPEYESRSIMLVGTDYFLIFDQTGTNWRANNRFAWFVNKEDALPNIIFFGAQARRDHWTTSSTFSSRGFYRDAIGSQLTLVTHKSDIRPLGGTLVRPQILPDDSIFEFVPSNRTLQTQGVQEIQTSNSRDIIFRDRDYIDCTKQLYSFKGNAGVARRMNDGTIQLVIFKGSHISLGKVSLSVESDSDCAVAMSFKGGSYALGKFDNYGNSKLSVKGLSGGKFYIDGAEVEVLGESISLAKGSHSIEYTIGAPIPMSSEIVATEDIKGATKITISRPLNVDTVIIELSSDGGKNWDEIARTKDKEFTVSLKKKGKYHVRAISLNGETRAVFAQEYPLYLNSSVPNTPDGLRLKLSDSKVSISWGKVLGVNSYRLFRKKNSEKNWTKVYEGSLNFWEDNLPEVVRCDRYPSNITTYKNTKGFYQYYVISVNGRGQSKPSRIINTNPSSWANWYPHTELKFKRRSAFWMPPYVYEEQMPPIYYPD
ncbi:MAG: hypothetical protein ACOXZI_06610 [Candidatus Cryptobacteroides sp.]|jgi:hypothetical protein